MKQITRYYVYAVGQPNYQGAGWEEFERGPFDTKREANALQREFKKVGYDTSIRQQVEYAQQEPKPLRKQPSQQLRRLAHDGQKIQKQRQGSASVKAPTKVVRAPTAPNPNNPMLPTFDGRWLTGMARYMASLPPLPPQYKRPSRQQMMEFETKSRQRQQRQRTSRVSPSYPTLGQQEDHDDYDLIAIEEPDPYGGVMVRYEKRYR
jgi:hypothetical protein